MDEEEDIEENCQTPCDPDIGCPYCASYWQRMIDEGYWYDRYQERVAHTVVVGSRATDHAFLDFVGRETKLSFTPAHVLVNLHHEHEQVPMITKEDTYKYAVAIGAALM
jgi:hypothetical protein